MSAAALHILGEDPPKTSGEEIKAAEIAKLQATLQAARQGKATLLQLAEAYDIAERYKLGVTMVELRKHIVSLVQPEPNIVVVARSPLWNLVIGVIAGFLVHMFVSARSHKQPASSHGPDPDEELVP
jgi:hypothetical protein